MNRRQFLKVAGVAGGAGALALGVRLAGREGDGAARPPPARDGTATDAERPDIDPPPGGTDVRHADEYENVVDAVAAGADPEGTESVNAVIDEAVGDDTLLSFPAGTYRLRPTTIAGYSRLAIAAAGEGRVRFVAPEGLCLGRNPYLQFQEIDDLLLERIDFDFRNAGAGGILQVVTDGDATIRDVSTIGSCADQVAAFRIDILDENGTGLVENLHTRNGGDNKSLTGVYVGRQHAGDLTFRNCDLEGFSDNGLYASAPGLEVGADGVVNVEGGTYTNNNISNVRLGSTGSTARGVTIVVDSIPPSDGAVNARGIRLRNKRDQRIEDCTLTLGANSGPSFGAIVFHGDNQGALVRNTRVTVHRDNVPAVRAFPREKEAASAPVFENFEVTGSATSGFAVDIDSRDGTTFRGCTIEQTGRDRGGLHLSNSTGCRIADSHIDVTGDPIVLRHAELEVRNTTVVTPDGERHIDRLTASDGDFTPRSNR